MVLEVESKVLLPMDNGVVRRTWNYVPSPMIDGIPKESLMNVVHRRK